MNQLACVLLIIMAQQLSAQTEFLSIDKALDRSSQEQKPIMLIFSGSDWCKPCIQLKKSILDTKAFSDLSEELIMMYLDFPYKRSNRLSKEETKHNESLAEQYNKSGHFPKIVFLDQEGKPFTEFNYEKGMTVDHFISNIKKIISIYENEKT